MMASQVKSSYCSSSIGIPNPSGFKFANSASVYPVFEHWVAPRVVPLTNALDDLKCNQAPQNHTVWFWGAFFACSYQREGNPAIETDLD
jgi:hypothetical protein